MPYAIVSGNKTPSLGNGGTSWAPPSPWTSIQNSSQDNNYAGPITLSSPMPLAGASSDLVYAVSNHYLTFGSTATTGSGLAADWPNVRKLFLAADNWSSQRVARKTVNGVTSIRYQGVQATSGSTGSPTVIYEINFYPPSVTGLVGWLIEILVGNHVGPTAGITGLYSTDTLLASFTLAATSSFVLESNADGTAWTAHSNKQVVSNRAQFTADDYAGTVPHSVNFTDTSYDPSSWAWDFKDGNTSTVQNPSHTFTTPGLYEVELSIDGGAATTTRRIVVYPEAQSTGGTKEWLTRTAAAEYDWVAVDWSATQGLFVAVANAGGAGTDRIMTSPDGSTWTLRTTSESAAFVDVMWLDLQQKWLAATDNTNAAWASKDGYTWYKVVGDGVSNIRGLAHAPYFGGDKMPVYVGGATTASIRFGNNAVGSDDDVKSNSSTGNTTGNANWHRAVWGNHLVMVGRSITGGSNSDVIINRKSTLDFNSWTSVSSGTGYHSLNGLTYNPSGPLYVASNIDDTTTDGIATFDSSTWSPLWRTTPLGKWYSVIWCSGLARYLAVDGSTAGAPNKAMESSDAITWSAKAALDKPWRGLAYSPELELAVAVGHGGGVMTYSDGAPLPDPPVAEFSASPTSGTEPLRVSFSDLSTNVPTSWDWAFGDGGTSTQQHPIHSYLTAGTYTVSLTVTNAGGSDEETKTNYITVNPRVLSSYAFSYLMPRLPAGTFSITSGSRAIGAIDCTWEMRGPIRGTFDITYNPSTRIIQTYTFSFAKSISSEFTIAYAGSSKVRNTFTISNTMGTRLISTTSISYEVLDSYHLRSEFSFKYVFSSSPAVVSNSEPAIQVNPQDPQNPQGAGSQTLALLSAEVSADEGGDAWEATATLANLQDYSLFTVNTPFTLLFLGEEYQLIVDGRGVDRSDPADVKVTVYGVSPIKKYAGPRAAQVSKTWSNNETAREICLQMIPNLQWDILDWVIPPNVLGVEKTYPIDVVKTIAQAAGALLESLPDGTPRVRYKHVVSVPNYGDNTFSQLFTDLDDNFSYSEKFAPNKIENLLTIRNEQDASQQDRVEFIPEEDSRERGTIRVYPATWREDVALRTTGVVKSMVPKGVVTREEEEEVEFVNGVAKVSFPIVSIVSVTWNTDSLGGVTFEDYKSELKSVTVGGYSLGKVKYTTKSHNWDIEKSSTTSSAQFIVEKP